MLKLAEMTKIIFEDHRDIFMKKAEEVDKELLRELSLSFSLLAVLFQEMIDQWFGSTKTGLDAVQTSDKLEDRFDLKISQTEKLDFEQLKKK